MTTLATINLISRNIDRTLATLARQPDVKREVEYFKSQIEQVKSIDDFLKNDRVYRFAMKAFGLGDLAYAKAFMRKALSEGIDARDAFVNKLSDNRYREFVETFNFNRYGEAATIFDRARQGTVDRYLRQTLEEQEGAQNESVRLALYFQRKASQIKDPLDILSDMALTRFTYTMLGLSPTTSAVAIDKQVTILQSKIDFSDFQSPDRVARMISRFAAIADTTSAPAAGGTGLLLSGKGPGLGIDLMLAMQRAGGLRR